MLFRAGVLELLLRQPALTNNGVALGIGGGLALTSLLVDDVHTAICIRDDLRLLALALCRLALLHHLVVPLLLHLARCGCALQLLPSDAWVGQRVCVHQLGMAAQVDLLDAGQRCGQHVLGLLRLHQLALQVLPQLHGIPS